MIPGSLGEGICEWNVRGGMQRLKAHCSRYFWLWITYQTIKGLTTTTLVWVPLVIWWFDR
jgi:hypothetical protein